MTQRDHEWINRLIADRDALVKALEAVKHGAEYPDELGDMIDAALALVSEQQADGQK